MPEISGKNFALITVVNGVSKFNVSQVSGVPFSQGATCIREEWGYSDGRRNPPEFACSATPQFYDFDNITGKIYVAGGCGITPAPSGYYKAPDGLIFFWDGNEMTFYGECR